MMLLFGFDRTVADWVAERIGKPFGTFDHAIGMVDRIGRLRGGVVFTGHTGASIEMSIAGGPALSRGFMAAIAHYVFEQLKCQRLQIHTKRSNKSVTTQANRLGFKFEGVSRRLYGAEDGLCYSLTVDDLPGFKKRWKI